MKDAWEFIERQVSLLEVQAAIKVLLVLLSGFIVVRLIRWRLRSGHSDSGQARLVAMRLATVVVYGVMVLWALSLVGVEVGVLLGAAGVLTVALGFAAQASTSNLISGFFLMGERPFKIGDVIEVNSQAGEVVAIDLMSTKVRTFDNLLVRIPNETVLKATLVNKTHYEIRRYDLMIDVAYDENLDRVESVLLQVAEDSPSCLRQPEPVVFFDRFGDSGMRVQFSVWLATEEYGRARRDIASAVRKGLATAGIEIPFPHRVLIQKQGASPSQASESSQ